MGRLFGTDGVRGIANHDLTPELAYELGRVGTAILAQDMQRPRILIGKDTRISGDMLEAALLAGICSMGGDAYLAGIVPTPAVAFLTRQLQAHAGIMISASHNPVEDNGIKFFHGDGFKLPDLIEDNIEAAINAGTNHFPRPVGADIGRVVHVGDAAQRYIQFALGTISGTLKRLKVVVDCANGAASLIAPAVYGEAGVEVIAIHHVPDGTNINRECGSTHPHVIQEEVRRAGADLGLTHDGDADRVLACDHQGNLVDGDQILAICGLDMLKKGKLPDQTIVATVMSNLGLDLAFRRAGGRVIRTNVGDRYVLEAMRDGGFILGGEQSGHIINLGINTTGDGIITALQLMSVIRDSGKDLKELAGQVQKMPQALVNVVVADKEAIHTNIRIQEALIQASRQLGDRGRILIRPSGTESKVRVMVECEDLNEMEAITQRFVDMVKEELAGIDKTKRG